MSTAPRNQNESKNPAARELELDHADRTASATGGAEVLGFPGPDHRSDQSQSEAGPSDVRLRDLIGDVLREERLRQERTLVQVAEEAAVSVPYLSEVERGRKEVSSDLLAAIHTSLGLELSDVLERANQRLVLRVGTSVGMQRGHGARGHAPLALAA